MQKAKTQQAVPPAPAVPRHVAIIMDGNGRWAKKRGQPRLAGHRAGADALRRALRACRNHGVEYLTVYAFSTENWVRPKLEVTGLMRLLKTFLKKDEHELHENGVRLRVTGRIGDLPPAVRAELERVMEATGGRAEIADAARSLAADAAAGRLDPAAIDETAVASRLYLPDVPDPDLLIRTSGECRLSNFLLWEASYSEFVFTDVLWPDFGEDDFAAALAEYARRQRRFGAPS